MLDMWWYLYSTHSTHAENARKSIKVLEVFESLNAAARSKVVLFTDDESGNNTSTLKEFCADVKSTNGFTDFLNQRQDIVQGFVGHKNTPNPYTQEQYEQVMDDDILKPGAPISVPLQTQIYDWLKYRKDHALRQDYYQKGKDFETVVINLYKNKDPQLLSDLAAVIGLSVLNDPKTRVISQAYLCLPGGENCNAQKGYFVADFVFLKYDITNQLEGVIVADIKLSPGTKLTANQATAKSLSDLGKLFSVKTVPNNGRDINDVLLPTGTYTVGKDVRVINFIEIHGNGGGAYSPGGIIK